jgi:hypothetical protein
MSASRNVVDSVRRTVSTITTRAGRVVSVLAAAALTAAWSLFWLNLARLHNVQGDLVAATITMVVFIAPAVALFVRYVGTSLGVELPVSPLDGNATDR